MTRKMISLAGASVAVFALTFGSSDVEARHCRHRNRCCQQQMTWDNGCQTQGYVNRVQTNASNRCQQTGYYGSGQVTSRNPAIAINNEQQQQAPDAQASAPVPNN